MKLNTILIIFLLNISAIISNGDIYYPNKEKKIIPLAIQKSMPKVLHAVWKAGQLDFYDKKLNIIKVPEGDAKVHIIHYEPTFDVLHATATGWIVLYSIERDRIKYDLDGKFSDGSFRRLGYVLSNGDLLYLFPNQAPKDSLNYLDLECQYNPASPQESLNGFSVELGNSKVGIAIKSHPRNYFQICLVVFQILPNEVKTIFIDHSSSDGDSVDKASNILYRTIDYYLHDFDESGCTGIFVYKVPEVGTEILTTVYSFDESTGKYVIASPEYKAKALDWFSKLKNKRSAVRLHYTTD